MKQKNIYDFQQYETIISFGDSIFTHKANIEHEANEEHQSNLLNNIVEFNNKSGSISKEGKDKRRDTHKKTYALYECRKSTLNTFKSGTFPIKGIQGKGLKILNPQQMLQRLPITLAQVKAGITCDSLLNKTKRNY